MGRQEGLGAHAVLSGMDQFPLTASATPHPSSVSVSAAGHVPVLELSGLISTRGWSH